ncbi:MAG: 3-methyl-2-oxobutanoate hydroxymethyltransferase [Acidimicrobiales bacterium]|nr:3-methyl-2-oxobutanoate hydroxymethyltransferase [Acidimicrobiales bacterium]MBO0894090.1 3-methyl-2-oxobutanoate hydroxymethyltransferase [Acidimicrobiales bacterium]
MGPQALTVPALRSHKVGQTGADAARPGPEARPLVMVTAYDAPSARIADRAEVDLILVGDSVATAVLGYDNTLQVTVADMAHHVGAVARARPRPLVVADLPWLSYHTSPDDALVNAAVLVRAGAQAVKLEGGRRRLPAVRSLVDAEVPVMGHLGLTPQSVHVLGGYRVQAKDPAAAEALVGDAVALAEAGCFAIVLEGIPDVVARTVTETVPVPTIGIGAGPHCDGQVLVAHDLLGLSERLPKFARRYAELEEAAVSAMSRWRDDVRAGRYPTDAETYHTPSSLARSSASRSAMANGSR